MSPMIQAALDTMDEAWPGYGYAKTEIRRHVEMLESSVHAAHWAVWKDGDVEGALKILVSTGIIPMRPLLSKGKKAIKKVKP